MSQSPPRYEIWNTFRICIKSQSVEYSSQRYMTHDFLKISSSSARKEKNCGSLLACSNSLQASILGIFLVPILLFISNLSGVFGQLHQLVIFCIFYHPEIGWRWSYAQNMNCFWRQIKGFFVATYTVVLKDFVSEYLNVLTTKSSNSSLRNHRGSSRLMFAPERIQPCLGFHWTFPFKQTAQITKLLWNVLKPHWTSH